MILHFNNTTLEVQPNDSSYRYRSLMAKPQLVLKFSLPRYVEIPVGAYCEYMGETYYLNAPQNIKKQGTRNIEYTLNMGTLQDNMALYKMRNSVDHRLKWSMCAKPHEFIAEIIANLNERDGAGVWSIGTCIDANEKTIEFNHTNIDSALSQVAETFETEWEIVGTTIHLHKVEYYKSDPLPLSYGKGNGFMPGVGRTTPSNELPIKRLYVQGGDRNIDRSEYGSPELLLPKSQSLGYDGTHFSDEQGYNANIGHIYTSDANGYYIERSDVISDAVKEDSLDCSEHYPSRIGKVTSVIAVKPAKNFYDFIDNTIPADLNINDYIIEGETPTIVFQSGMLAGEKEFEFKYKHSERRFEIVPQEIDGQTMPNATFIPAVNDTYAIFGIMLPPSYICDNAAKEGASWDMMREAIRHLWENENQKFTFTGTLQSLYAKRNWINIGGKLIVGGYVHFSDTQFVPDGVDIRITGIKDFLTSPYSPTVEISNNVTGQSLTSKLREIDSQEVIIEENHKDALQFTRRRFRDAQESLSMLEDAFDNFSGSVNPVTVQTMAMLVGDESLQFQFVTAIDSATIDSSFQVTYDAANKQLSVPHSFLRHMTLGIDTIKNSHSISEYKTWEMTAYVSARLEDGSKKYYLYAKVDTAAAQNGEFLLSETPIDMESISGYYHLLLGVLNSEYDEQRSYVSLYGFTEILPARITTDRIVSADGQTYFDLVAGEIGGRIKFLARDSSYKDFEAYVEGLGYDNTQTAINGGIVTTGTIQLADADGKTCAGLTGDGNSSDSVRIWAGEKSVNKSQAPFRVLNNGDMYCQKGNFGSDSEFSGKVSIAGGKILLRTNGSGQLANGSISWNESGDISLCNLGALEGTFTGTINANNGLRLGVEIIHAESKTIKQSTVLCVFDGTSVYNPGERSDIAMNFPSNPNTGQLLTIKNISEGQLLINGNGHNIHGNGIPDYAYIGTTHYGTSIYLATWRAKMFVFDGTYWQQVGQYDY